MVGYYQITLLSQPITGRSNGQTGVVCEVEGAVVLCLCLSLLLCCVSGFGKGGKSTIEYIMTRSSRKL